MITGANKRLEAGDMEGRAVWVRIMKAIEELQVKGHPTGIKLH